VTRWVTRALVAGGGAAVLVLGAAANGFEPSLDRVHVSSASTTGAATGATLPKPGGLPLSVVVVKVLFAQSDNAVVVRVTNPSARSALTEAPIAIDLFDRTGKIVGTSAVVGADPLLEHVPYVAPGESALFVSDSIATSGVPRHARATATAIFAPVRSARLTVRAPRLRTSPFGSVADGTLVRSGPVGRRQVLIQAVVRRRGHLVAAGTTVATVPALGRARPFEIQLVGDAKGGKLRVWAPPG
jgi:hypothetical protein